MNKHHGESLSAKTEGQKNYIRAIVENTVVFATGPAGTGKTACAVGLAAQYYQEGKVNKIILTRPCVEASRKSFGALPGGLEEKMEPYLIPAVEELKKFLGMTDYNQATLEGNIVVAPLEFMRGRNFHNAFMILDEAQNANRDQIIMFVTRMGDNSKICVNGDVRQNDLRKTYDSDYATDLEWIMDKIEDLDQFCNVELTESDIVRNPLIGSFLRAVE